ncbi:hypothetical protein ACLQ20_23455 [Micromonospora sp. DT46]|uniref:hypothetical protein n=1 Tax=Micromonospora sp. DT46 TaxID=3393435 RepID=UPI003CED97AC
MHRGGVALAIVTVVAGPLLAAAPATAAPPSGVALSSTTVLAALSSPPSGVASRSGGALLARAGAPQPGPPGPRVFVEVSPSTVEPGFLVGIRASCQDNSVPATVVSDAFGRVQVQPQHGTLTAAPMVRERTRPGNYRIKLECRDGETASTMLQVVKAVKPSRGPATGFGGGGGGFTGGLLLPGGLALIVTGIVLAVRSARRPRTARR